MEERDTLRKEYDKLKASNKRADDDENASAILQFGTKNPWSMLQEMKEELDHEKNLNANLRLQLQKTQESNSELIFAVRDLEELLDQKKSEICYNQDSQGTECQKQLSHLRNSEDKQELLETTSDNEEEQCELDILVKEHDNIKVAYSQEQRILDLTSELELYKKDREDLEMQLEQLALDYEILKQENHDISSRLEQIQLREQLRMQYECSAHLSIINDLESHVENLEKELEKQSEEYEANLANLVRGKVEEEQRAIQAEEELRKTRWKNANTVEQLQGEFKRLSSQISTTFCANEDLVMKTLDESRALRMEKCHMEALLEEKNEELSSLQLQHRVNCQQLLSLVDFKTKEVDRLVLELKDKREELDKQKQSEEATQKATREEMSILKAEMEQLSREKHYLSEQIDQKEKQVAEVTKLRTSTKEVELQLQERNLERDVLEKELSLLREEAANLLEELNALRHLKDEQEVTMKALNLKVQTLMTQNTDLKIGFSDDELEKENLRELIFLLRGDLSKEVDVIATIEKRFKGKNVRGMVAEGTPMIYKSRGSFQAAHRSLHENSEPFDVSFSSSQIRHVQLFIFLQVLDTGALTKP
ncbi:myosin-3-like [Asparagus officinalis]|uniref:myosin-3-like n=1 Tax=Asparagus officinalis TaxID=4686 RepID=UPI00098E4380|nr:myosin-3-like [Asparagus officinalis]